jgi:hypothetical protein
VGWLRAKTVLLLCGCLFLAGCVTHPTLFTKGTAIPLDAYTVVVTSKEVSVNGKSQNVVIHFRTTGVNTREDVGKFFDLFGRRMKMLDRDGKEYDALPFTLNYYRSHQATTLDNPAMFPMFADTSNLRDWVAVAQAPSGTKGFSLYIGNPMARTGQPDAAIIDVDK